MQEEMLSLTNNLFAQIKTLNNKLREKEEEIKMLKFDLEYVTGVANDLLADSKERLNKKPNKQDLF